MLTLFFGDIFLTFGYNRTIRGIKESQYIVESFIQHKAEQRGVLALKAGQKFSSFFNSRVPVSHVSVTVSLPDQRQGPVAEAAKCEVKSFSSHLCFSLTVAC